MPSTSTADTDAFTLRWNQLDRRERKRLRRIARLGRPADGPEETALLAAYAKYQRRRPWMRAFWVWFLPGLVVALGVASQIHPLVIGIVLALAAQAVFTRRNLRRASLRA